jgi:hypothetical protein
MGKNHSKYVIQKNLNDFFSNLQKGSMPSRLDMELTEKGENAWEVKNYSIINKLTLE